MPRAQLPLALAALLWQPVPPDPGIGPDRAGSYAGNMSSRYGFYGEPEEASLEALARDPRQLHRRAVRVVGRLEQTRDGQWYLLREGTDEVLLVPADEIDESRVLELMSLPVEVEGVARELPEKQGSCLPGKLQSKCEDPLLPPLPDRMRRHDWPRGSITYWSISDATPVKPLELWEPSQHSTLVRLAAAPEQFEQQKVTVLGQFCGTNLYGDLPAESRREESDWVIREGDSAIWITGKDPKGKGWRLDVRSESESRWWIEVTGEVESRNGIAYLKARTLALKPAPASHRQ
jgi:hypothetical protein